MSLSARATFGGRRIVTAAEVQRWRAERAAAKAPGSRGRAKLGDVQSAADLGLAMADEIAAAHPPPPPPPPRAPVHVTPSAHPPPPPPPPRAPVHVTPSLPLPSIGAAERNGDALATLTRAERGLRLGRQVLELLATEADTAVGLLALTLATDGVRRAVCDRPRDEQRALDDDREQMQLALRGALRRGRRG
jgi:hypothetical protein